MPEPIIDSGNFTTKKIISGQNYISGLPMALSEPFLFLCFLHRVNSLWRGYILFLFE